MNAATALLVTDDECLLEDVLRLAAAAGVPLDVAHDTGAALRSWSQATVVLVGVDQLPSLSRRRPVRRDQVHVLGRTPMREGCFRDAVTLRAENVVELPAGEAWLVELLTDVADGSSSTALTVAVVAGSGGAGASTFAAALAQSASPRRRTLLVDVDPMGGGVDRIVGLEQREGIGWEALLESSGRFSSRSLRDSLPRREALAILTWTTASRARLEPFTVREAVSAAQRGNDIVVVDLPRYPDEVSRELLPRCDHVLLVSGLTLSAVVAASRVAAHLMDSGRPVSLVTRGRTRGLSPDDIARTLALPLLVAMSEQRRLAESVDLGMGPVTSSRSPLARAARAVLEQLDSGSNRAA